MIKNSLTCHNRTASSVIKSVTAKFEAIAEGGLRVHYQIEGQLALLRIPDAQPAISCAGLSEHTCFEVFVAVKGNSGYHEFNFSPSGQWAAYAFNHYRSPGKWTFNQKPYSRVIRTENHLFLEATIPGVDLPPNINGKPLHLGLSAVLEATNGTRSYWALHHPSDRPDFHHRAGFACILNTEYPDKFPAIKKDSSRAPESA